MNWRYIDCTGAHRLGIQPDNRRVAGMVLSQTFMLSVFYSNCGAQTAAPPVRTRRSSPTSNPATTLWEQARSHLS
jgi:hypothetical protein